MVLFRRQAFFQVGLRQGRHTPDQSYQGYHKNEYHVSNQGDQGYQENDIDTERQTKREI